MSPEFDAATHYLKVAMEEATDEEGRHVLLAAIRQIAEATRSPRSHAAPA